MRIWATMMWCVPTGRLSDSNLYSIRALLFNTSGWLHKYFRSLNCDPKFPSVETNQNLLIAWTEKTNASRLTRYVKKNTLNAKLIDQWAKNIPTPYTWENLLNKSGITWRQLSDDDKNSAHELNGAIELIIKKPSVMKRPLITKNDLILTLGYDENLFQKIYLWVKL